jgi:hypothetical protein
MKSRIQELVDRGYYLPVSVYVLKDGPEASEAFGIARGSAIVGKDIDTDEEADLLVYFEGNFFGSHEIKVFAGRCLHAHSRWAMNYPTVAKSRVAKDDLIQVAVYHPFEKVVEVKDMDRLAAWCGWTLPVSGEELHAR